MAIACTPESANLEAAVAELQRLGVAAHSAWSVRLESSGEVRILPGVDVGGDSYTTDVDALATHERAMDWASIVATLARGVRA